MRGRTAVWAGLVAGSAMVCLAYALAGRATTTGEQAKFVVLWLGLLAFLWPAARRLADPLVGESERLAIIAAGGLFTYLPKFLRSPGRPVLFDEIAHWAQAERLFETGDLFRANPAVGVLPSFPGLHTLVAGLRHLTGLTTWQTAIVLVALLHVVGAVGVFLLVRRITLSPVVAGLAGLLWTVAPGAMFFNAQFAYQSLAIALFVWTAVAVVEAQAASGRPRIAWTAVAGVTTIGVVVTHHLTSYVLVLLLGLLTVAAVVARGSDSPGAWRPAAWALGTALVANVAWTLARGGGSAASSIIDYLSPYPDQGVAQLWRMFTASGDRRAFFVRSGVPGWERAAAFLAPVLVIGLGLLGVVLLRRMLRRPRSAAWALAALAVLYVVALPFVLTPTGSQGAHRSFAFTYLGVSLVAGAGLALVLGRTLVSTGRRRWAGPLAVASTILVITIGNTAANVNEFDRFPGPWEPGADSRSLTTELDHAATWLSGYGTTARVAADLYSGTAFGVLGTDREGCAVAASCIGSLEIWRFYTGEVIRPEDLRRLAADGYRFLAVDRRMAATTPRSGIWFNRAEPDAFAHTEPYPRAALTRLEGLPWLTKVFASTSFDVYEIDVGAAEAHVLRGRPGAAGPVPEREEHADSPRAGPAAPPGSTATTTTTSATTTTTAPAGDVRLAGARPEAGADR